MVVKIVGCLIRSGLPVLRMVRNQSSFSTVESEGLESGDMLKVLLQFREM